NTWKERHQISEGRSVRMTLRIADDETAPPAQARPVRAARRRRSIAEAICARETSTREPGARSPTINNEPYLLWYRGRRLSTARSMPDRIPSRRSHPEDLPARATRGEPHP